MIATEKQKLPKLQFGEGTLAYTDTGTIAYKKYVELSDGSKVRKTVNSTSITKCIKRMRDVEEDLTRVGNIDLTSIAMGYLKSIEQLLFEYIKLHTREKDGRTRRIHVGNKRYADQRGNAVVTNELMTNEDKTKDINLGSLRGFFGFHFEETEERPTRYSHRNKDLLEDGITDETYEFIIDTLSGVSGLRNGYFHKHNLHSWDTVIDARNDARKVYFLMLGAYKLSESEKEDLGILRTDEHDDYYKLCAYMNKKAYESGGMILEGNNYPIYYLEGQTDLYAFWTLHQDEFIEYDSYGEPIYSGIYFGQLGNKQQFKKATRENLPSEIWEGVLTISGSVPIQFTPSGPKNLVYKDGRFMK